MGYYLYDSKGYVGDIASILGFSEMRDFLCETDDVFHEFFDSGYTLDFARLCMMLSVTESDDIIIDDTIVNLRNLLKGCHDIAIINGDDREDREASVKNNVQKTNSLKNDRELDAVTRCKDAIELYRPWGRRAQDYAYGEYENLANESEAKLTRGVHRFDLQGDKVFIMYGLVMPDELVEKVDF